MSQYNFQLPKYTTSFEYHKRMCTLNYFSKIRFELYRVYKIKTSISDADTLENVKHKLRSRVEN